jgi:uncharacterized protein (DUF1778 family)
LQGFNYLNFKLKGLIYVPKIKEEKTFKRISIALTEETYEGVKALAAVTGSTLTDYVANILNAQVAKNKIVIQQVRDARAAYEDLLLTADKN